MSHYAFLLESALILCNPRDKNGKYFWHAEQVTKQPFKNRLEKARFTELIFVLLTKPSKIILIVHLNIILVNKGMKKKNLIEFKPYFVENCCFLKSLIKSMWPKKAFLWDHFDPQKSL